MREKAGSVCCMLLFLLLSLLPSISLLVRNLSRASGFSVCVCVSVSMSSSTVFALSAPALLVSVLHREPFFFCFSTENLWKRIEDASLTMNPTSSTTFTFSAPPPACWFPCSIQTSLRSCFRQMMEFSHRVRKYVKDWWPHKKTEVEKMLKREEKFRAKIMLRKDSHAQRRRIPTYD